MGEAKRKRDAGILTRNPLAPEIEEARHLLRAMANRAERHGRSDDAALLRRDIAALESGHREPAAKDLVGLAHGAKAVGFTVDFETYGRVAMALGAEPEELNDTETEALAERSMREAERKARVEAKNSDPRAVLQGLLQEEKRRGSEAAYESVGDIEIALNYLDDGDGNLACAVLSGCAVAAKLGGDVDGFRTYGAAALALGAAERDLEPDETDDVRIYEMRGMR